MKNYLKWLGISSLMVMAQFATAQQQDDTQPEPTEQAQVTESQTDEQQAYIEWAQSVWSQMSPQTGSIALANDVATLEVPEDFYYLNSDDAKRVLTEIWGNPPEVAEGILGMLFPADQTPFDGDSWGVTIEYEQDGYVSDEDTADIDYAEMLEDMQADVRESSKARVEQGYEAIELVGWASQPYYDAEAHKLHWAKELMFGDNSNHTLNYNIRVLGRQGVLVMNFIAGMAQFEEIKPQVPTVLAMADFNQGSRYSDFNPDIDEVAAYGIGALVAGKVAAKLGILAGALLLLKKFWFLLVLGGGAILKWFKRTPKAQ